MAEKVSQSTDLANESQHTSTGSCLATLTSEVAPNRVKVRSRLHANWRGNRSEIRGDIGVIFLKCGGQELEALIDASDLENVLNHAGSWYALKSKHTFYVVGRYPRPIRKFVYLHRFLMSPSVEMVVDHKNHNGLDNRRSNLRVTSQSINALNAKGPRSTNRCGRRGVIWNKSRRKWEARVDVNGERSYLGCFEDIDKAAEAVRRHVDEILSVC